MNNQNDRTDIIEKYLDNKLSPTETENFEDEFFNDEALNKEFNQHQLIIDGIRLAGRKSLLNKTREWDHELGGIKAEQQTHSHIHSFRWYYLAAAISLIAVSVFVIYSRLDTGFDKVVASYYEPYNYIPGTQRGEANASRSADEIIQYYDRGEYAIVIDLINKMDQPSKTEIFNFLQANAYQALGQYEKAISIFKDLVNSGSMYSLSSKWYLSLCYLSENKIDLALPLLEELKNSNSSFTIKSQKLLNDLQQYIEYSDAS